MSIILQKYNGITILRDDLLPGGTNYEKKAYDLMLKYGQGRMLFWNVYS